MKIVCVGSGYVGSVTAAAFATMGYATTVIDTDESKVKLLQAGKSPIYEPGLQQLLGACIGNTLSASSSYDAIKLADVVFICVGTPSLPGGDADLKYVRSAAEMLAPQLSKERFTLIVLKSTVPVGTAQWVGSMIEEMSGLALGESFSVLSNPEFLREGYALEDVFFPDRIVVGALDSRARLMMQQLYRPFLQREQYEDRIGGLLGLQLLLDKPAPIYFETDMKSAELIKYASNAFLAVKISYVNELARLSEALGVNAPDVAKGMGLDARIGSQFLQISCGWSGSCFPKDTEELLATSARYGQELSIVRAAVQSNERMHSYCIEKLRNRLKNLHGRQIGVLGLTFKPNTDDARHTQASKMIEQLLAYGAAVRVHDPQGQEMFRSLHPKLPVHYCDTAADTATRSDALLLVTHWQEYGDLDWPTLAAAMRRPYILDTRNFLSKAKLQQSGFHYEGIGTE